MAKKSKIDRDKNENGPKGVEGINILTDSKHGVYVEGAEQVIDMYEKGQISRSDLYNSILDLEVVFKGKNVVESKREEDMN